jgi:uncharacterized peroxidase-related enzyme
MADKKASLDISMKTVDTVEAEGKPLLESAQKALGFVPNMYGNMAHMPDLLATYMSGYDGFRKNSGFKPAEQETVFLAISQANGCSYCVAAHSMLADKMSGVPSDSIKALRSGSDLPDAKLNALAAFTRKMVKSAGWPDKKDVDAFLKAGYSERHIFAIILAIGVKTLSNYTNHVAGTPVDEAFKAYSAD